MFILIYRYEYKKLNITHDMIIYSDSLEEAKEKWENIKKIK